MRSSLALARCLGCRSVALGGNHSLTSLLFAVLALSLSIFTTPLTTSIAYGEEFTLSVGGIASGKEMPKKFTADGENVSPTVSWKGVPQFTKELVLFVDDPDAPGSKPWSHWVVYNLPASTASLPEGFNGLGASFGKNSWNQAIYRGPEPPKNGKFHRYVFTLYALPHPLKLPPGLPRDAVKPLAVKTNLGVAEFVTWYKR